MARAKATKANGSPAPTRSARKRETLSSSPLARRLLAKLRPICLGLPDTEEVEAWGHPTFRVGGKIFVGFGADQDKAQMGVKTSHEMQASLVASDHRFTIAAYVGKHGWVDLDLSGKVDWGEVEALIRESYRLVAPARRARTAREKPAPKSRRAR